MFDQKSDSYVSGQPLVTPLSKAGQSGMAPNPVDDMFGSTQDSQPDLPSPTVLSQPVNPVFSSNEDIFGQRSIWDNKILAIGLVVFIALVLGFFIFAAINYFSEVSKNGKINRNKTVVGQEAGNQSIDSASATTQVDQSSSVMVPAVVTSDNNASSAIDTDGDGLTDQQEQLLGTDKNKADTDGDGLIDGAEVNVFHTDPKNPDTDGDGFKDGDEVVNGFDPLKPGEARLYQIPGATNN